MTGPASDEAAPSDADLLGLFVGAGNEDAFRALVERHAALVFATCMRGLGGDADLARDAAQAVFVILARKAAGLRKRQSLAGWLFRVSRSVVTDMTRKEIRRRHREEEAARLAAAHDRMAGADEQAERRAELDRALARLRADQREALLLYFGENRTQADVAHAIGCSPAAVEKRISRGLARLRVLLARRETAVSAVALAAAFAGDAAQAAPAGLAAACHATAMAGVGLGSAAASSISLGIAEGTMKTMMWAQIKTAAAAVCAATMVGGGTAAVLAARTGTALSIPAESPYQTVTFENLGPAGFRSKPLPGDWQADSLDGAWKFREVAGTGADDIANPLDDEGMSQGFFSREFDDSGWADIPVPASFYHKPKAQSVSHLTGWYRRRFALAPERLAGGRRLILDFRRAAWQTDVWLNGRQAGARHVGKWDSFQYDITPLAQPGENTLAVRVYDVRGSRSYLRREIGGLYHPVRLLSVPAPVSAHRLKITTLLEEHAIEIEAELLNATGRPVPCRLRAEVADWAGGQVRDAAELGRFTVQPGAAWTALGRVKLAAPVCWTPDNPHLYTLRLADENGHSVAFERFGFRDFRARGEWLCLNGEKFKPRGFTLDAEPRLSANRDADMEAVLRHMKSLHVNMIRPHSMHGILFETFYILADELGFVVYEDYEDCFRRSGPSLEERWADYRRHALDYYSHASLCMWSFGNELYEYQRDKTYSKELDWLYGQMRELDRQGRPISTSSGRHTWEAISAGLLKERTDVLDDHQYRGYSCGSWQENIGHIERYAKAALEYYGSPKPKIDCEYGVPGDTIRYRNLTFDKLYPTFQLDPASAKFKRKYIEYLRSEQAEIGIYIRTRLNHCAPRLYVTNEAECRRLWAEKPFKRAIEIYRRAETKCLGGHTNSQWYDLLTKGKWAETAARYGMPGPIDAKGEAREAWIATPASFVLKRVYNPTLVSAAPFNPHPLPGSSQTLEIFVTNDLNEPGEFRVEAQLRLGAAAPLVLPILEFGSIDAMSQKAMALPVPAPAVRQTQRGRLELFLFRNGERVGDNVYPVSVVADRRPTPGPAAPRIALYDAADRLFGPFAGQTTTEVFRELGVPTTPIKDFSNLNAWRLLIIGANSFDKTLVDAGETIHAWVKRGGKLLCLEQNLCGKVPFYPNYSVVAGTPSTYVSLAVPAHPAFEGLVQEDFDSWAGRGGTLFDYALSPLNEGLVAIAPTGSDKDRDSPKPVLADVKLGRGQIVFSQIAALERQDVDSAARAYLRNLLGYLARDGVQPFALELEEQAFTRSAFVESKDALAIDLRKFVNRGFVDRTAGDGEGWADFGSGLDAIPTGTSRLQGRVPFDVIDPAANGGKACLVLKGAKNTGCPGEVTGIPVNAELNSVFFLHTAMYAAPGPSVKYVFHYENGETREFVAETERDIPDWWQAKDRANAIVVYREGQKGLYLCEFANPLPKIKIVSMDIVSAEKSVPIVVAVTGRKRLLSVVAGVGEK
ncbi:MAG: sigma-70 family RNA polymerase sigma factor [Kiritimatiellae bacterium]|nr:sigma-70 family RNA polymerase sigma factor [Kiritimatiellia bacterium]